MIEADISDVFEARLPGEIVGSLQELEGRGGWERKASHWHGPILMTAAGS